MKRLKSFLKEQIFSIAQSCVLPEDIIPGFENLLNCYRNAAGFKFDRFIYQIIKQNSKFKPASDEKNFIHGKNSLTW